MKKENPFRYISNRIAFMAAMIGLCLMAYQAEQTILLWQGEICVWKWLLHLGITGFYFAAAWFWIFIPYRRSEKFVERIQDGHMISGSGDLNNVLLTPSAKRQMEMTETLLKSPQLIDLNERQAQYLALQNQINPHFLYNTLESIRGEALIAGLDSVADMTEALAKFFRYTITRVENLVSVEEELDNCETYFRIQQYRFGDRLRLHVTYEEEDREDIMSCRIPKLTLQPILENSIIHGTERKVGTSTLRIHFTRTQKRLLIRISDDGVGMDEETLAALNDRLNGSGGDIACRENGRRGGIALTNVNNRIHLIFGEEYGMHVYSIPQKGTDVELTIPLTGSDIKIDERDLLS